MRYVSVCGDKYTCTLSLVLLTPCDFMSVGGQMQNEATLETEDGSETTEPTEFNPRADPENKKPTRTESEIPADYRNCSYSPI